MRTRWSTALAPPRRGAPPRAPLEGLKAVLPSALVPEAGLFEPWDTQEALDSHLETAHTAAFGHAMVTVVDRQASLTRYEIAGFSSYAGSDDA